MPWLLHEPCPRSLTATKKPSQRALGEFVVDHSMNQTEKPSSSLLFRSRTSSPIGGNASDPSELSSGMIICDLSNEFRRLRVRRKHHQTTVNKGRPRSKPRPFSQRTPEGSSSDDDRRTMPSRKLLSLPARAPFRSPALQSQQRCAACAIRLTLSSSSTQCRCGKTLCSRHRAGAMHICTKLRKLQDVSD